MSYLNVIILQYHPKENILFIVYYNHIDIIHASIRKICIEYGPVCLRYMRSNSKYSSIFDTLVYMINLYGIFTNSIYIYKN